ncbi:GDNF family receptor alpha-4 [Oryzias melastigma]|uniref:GDNF family receptor alpha 3 n=2 Tax=Oryzias melastigma TaxID=30732 RepID=A0A3B3DFS7_ORYME|nr:GDNF family receptor alpha-4 [Oryzias melastigma]
MSRHAAGPAHDMSADPLLLSLAQAARARERWRSGTARTCARRGCPCSPLRSSLRRIPPRLLLPARRNKRQPRGQSWFGSVNVSTSRAPPCSAHSGAAGPGAVPLLSVLTRSRMAPPGMVLLLLLAGVLPSSGHMFPFPPSASDCVEAHRVCLADPQCVALYRGLELCAADAALSPLGEQVASECLERQDALLAKHPSLLTCKCQRGSRKEERCLRIYWRVRLLPGNEELEVSPYDDTLIESHLASLVAASSFLQLDGENQCLKAAQDCGLFEKCGSLRSEYVLACTKPHSSTNRCNQNKCHRLLRRFLERVPEEYSLGLLFCPCTNALCGERRRKTIVPSCSYQIADSVQPNCLHQQSFCRHEDTCRSRLADFISNCQPSHQTASGCLKDSTGLCLRAYAGLIGTIMTPNYISNSSADVSLWCNCEGSGNQWPDCLKLQRLFTDNRCLRNAINRIGSPRSPASDTTQLPAPRPSPLVQGDELQSSNHLPELSNNVMDSDEEEDLTQTLEEEEEDNNQFSVILYSEATVSSLGAPGTGGAASPTSGSASPALLLVLLLSASLNWG